MLPLSSGPPRRWRACFLVISCVLLLLPTLACRRRSTVIEPMSQVAAIAGTAGAMPTESSPMPAEPEGLGLETVVPPSEIYVHVSGAVVLPGVYILTDGQRAYDALAAAGGAVPDAVLEAVNLAAPLVDAQKLHIPTKAEWQRAAAGEPGLVAGISIHQPLGAAAGPVDLNTAGSTALQSLPGIGPVLASRIIAHRTAHGPFATVDDLLKVSGIGASKLADIRPYARVGRAP